MNLTKEEAMDIIKKSYPFYLPKWEHLWDAPDGTYKGRCPKCGFVHVFIESHDSHYNYCPQCGLKLKGE